jgi:hypothetical protein
MSDLPSDPAPISTMVMPPTSTITGPDVARIAERCRAGGNATIGDQFSDLARALVRESHWLRAAPEATAAVLWNRLRRFGWNVDELDGQLRVPDGASFLRVRHAHMRESPTLIRDLAGHTSIVNACAVTSDGRCWPQHRGTVRSRSGT